MTYQYKEKTVHVLTGIIAVLLDIFFLSWVLMKLWNETVTSVFKIGRITYTDAILLRLAYSALTSGWFVGAYTISSTERRFDSYANMVSTGISRVVDIVKSTPNQLEYIRV